MIEFRWVVWNEEERYLPEPLVFKMAGKELPKNKTVKKRKLQYRKQIAVTDYQTENYITVQQWTDWLDIPEVNENE